MADERNWKPRQLTDSELNREITEHHQLLQQPLSPLQRDDVETALRAFVLQRDQRPRHDEPLPPSGLRQAP
jgi:hypothetical protein